MTEPELVESASLVHTGDVPPSYDRLTYDQLGILLKLHADGTPQTVIAKALGCDQGSISRALKRLGTDTVTLAKHHLRSRAYRAAKRVTTVMERGKPDEQLKAAKVVLAGSGVIQEVSAGVAVQVIVGTPQARALAQTPITLTLDDPAQP